MQHYSLSVQSGLGSYSILIEDDFSHLGEAIARAGLKSKRICIVADSNTASLYLEEVKHVLNFLGAELSSFIFPAGEEHKNLDTVREIYETLIEHAFDRRDVLLALGGGVTGDLCGFCAATYLRGIRFVQVPTSLLSQVDSSIGGKTGVDFLSYKNMVGAFHMPSLVYSNVSAFRTLPAQEFASGMGEVIKHGLIRDREYYHWLWSHREQIKSKDPAALAYLVYVSDRIKKAVVEEDPYEKGIRGILNFGHTLGHAIEKEENFTLNHGSCVALGMAAAFSLCIQKGYLLPEDRKDLEKMLSYYNLPHSYALRNREAVLKATLHDKKMEGGQIKFILLKKIGEAFIEQSITLAQIKEALEEIDTAFN